jgi:hypothetical protein
MTNLVIPHVISISNVALSNVFVTTNADGTAVVITQTGMRTVAVGPGAWGLLLLVVAVAVWFLMRTFGRREP